MNKHTENCSAPICIESENNNVIWWVGEQICRSNKSSRLKDNQIKLNELFRRGKVKELVFTDTELMGLTFSKRGRPSLENMA